MPQQAQITAKMEILHLNMMLIGDYIATAFTEYEQKWMVQAKGNATFESTLKAISNNEVIVNRRYIFVHLGANQIHTVDKDSAFKFILEITAAIREKSPQSRIFWVDRWITNKPSL